MPLEIRWQNFRAFKDTGLLNLRPLTVIIGPNNSGKTSLLAPLLLLKQTLEERTQTAPLLGEGSLIGAGQFVDMAHEHVAESEISFTLGLRLEDPVEGPLPAMGRCPPGILELTFADGADSPSTLLTKYRVLDGFRRPFLSRALNAETGNYDVAEFAPQAMPGPSSASDPPTNARGDSPQSSLHIQKSQPDRFLFTSEGIVKEALRQTGGTTELPQLELSNTERYYMAIVDYIGQQLRQTFRQTSFLGPIRAAPSRVYPISSSPPESVGPDGRLAAEMLFRREDLLAKVNHWVKRFEFGESVRADPLSPDAFRLLGLACLATTL